MRNEGENLTAVSIYLSILIGLKTYFWFLQFFFGFALLFPNVRLFLTPPGISHLISQVPVGSSWLRGLRARGRGSGVAPVPLGSATTRLPWAMAVHPCVFVF
jgi:hypothetical protein